MGAGVGDCDGAKPDGSDICDGKGANPEGLEFCKGMNPEEDDGILYLGPRDGYATGADSYTG